LKFSKKDDSIIVVAKVTEIQNKTDEVELLIQIRDQGVGISEED
jgi:signal transduction histidine kinase